MAVAVREWRNSGDDRRRAAVRACARTASICAHAVMAAWRRRRPFQSARAASEAVVDEHDAGAKRRHGEPRRAHRRGKRQFAAGDPGTAHEPILQLRRQRRQRLEHVGGHRGQRRPDRPAAVHGGGDGRGERIAGRHRRGPIGGDRQRRHRLRGDTVHLEVAIETRRSSASACCCTAVPTMVDVARTSSVITGTSAGAAANRAPTTAARAAAESVPLPCPHVGKPLRPPGRTRAFPPLCVQAPEARSLRSGTVTSHRATRASTQGVRGAKAPREKTI